MAEEKTEKPAKEPKVKLTPEERRQRVRDARTTRVDAAFKGRKFEYVEKVSLGDGERYIDVSGNKGRHGHKIRDKKTGEELVVGTASLKVLADNYGGIKLPDPPAKVTADA